MILLKIPSGPLDTNAILIGCEKTHVGAVIDPSMNSAAEIFEEAKKKGLKIEKILLTHSHWDHFADAYAVKEKTGALLYVHKADAKNLLEPGSDKVPLFSHIESVKADHLIEDGEILFVGKLQLEVIHTPGHSPGSVCYYAKEEKILFSGDTLFAGSIGNLHLPTGAPSEMWSSLKKLAALPSDTEVIPGHGGNTTIGKEHWLSRAEEIFSER